MNKPIRVRAKIEAVIAFVIIGVLIITSITGALNFKIGTDSTGKNWSGGETYLCVPTVNNSNTPVTPGTLWLDNTTNALNTYNGTKWIDLSIWSVAENDTYIRNSKGNAWTADETNFQAAIDNVSAGGKVYLPVGTITITGEITGKDNVSVEGKGWGTVLDVSGYSGDVNFYVMGNDSYFKDIKIVGNTTYAATDWCEFQVANHTLIENVWFYENTYGITCDGKSNVYIINCRFEKIVGGQGWAACIHMSANTEAIYISNFFIKNCNRGIEIEDAAKNVYVQYGHIENVSSMAIDTHSHDGEGGADNIFFSDIYIKGSGINHFVRSTGSNRVDIPRNVQLHRIVFDNLTSKIRLGCIGFTMKDCKFVNCMGADDNFGAWHGLIHMDTYNEDSIFENVEFNNTFDAVDKFVMYLDGKNITIKDCEFNGYSPQCVRCTATVRNVIVKDNKFAMGTPAGVAFEARGHNISFSGNTIINGYLYLEDDLFNVNVYDNWIFGSPYDGLRIDGGSGVYKIWHNFGYVTENGSATTAADGGTITHGLKTTPTYVLVSGSVAGEMVSVTTLGATTFTIGIKDHAGNAGTTQVIYWRAYYKP